MEVNENEKSSNQGEVGRVVRGQYSKSYTQDDLRDAVEKIKSNEMSFGAASKAYNVPKTTLHNKYKHFENSPRGATTVLTKEQETELADWILLNADYGDPRTKLDIMIAAGQIAQLDSNESNHFKNGMPTSGWIDGFLKRHPLCRYRTPETISKASAVNTREDFAGLWRNIYQYFDRTNQLYLLNCPENWWNADETGFEKDPVPRKVVARKGAKRVSRRNMGKPKDVTTVTYAFSAAGDYVEPLITLKDSISTIAEIAFALGSVGANFGINQTEKGWAKSESFYYFVAHHLHKEWERKEAPKPRILTIDGYRAHLSLRLYRWCRLNDVIVIVLYPGGTPYLQMCDTTMFSPLKKKHEQLYSQWRMKHPTGNMNEVEFLKILKQVNDAVIKKEMIINGFRATGLQPFNFNNLNCDSLVSKSPDRIYDFKGDHVVSQEMPLTSNETASHLPINVINCVVLDPTSEFYIQPNNLLNLNDNILTSTHLLDSQKNLTNIGTQFLDGDIVENRSYSPVLLDPQQSTNFVPKLLDVEVANPSNSEVHVDSDQVGSRNDVINFSELMGPNGIFRSQFDTTFSLDAFGLTSDISGNQNASKIGKLTDKIRRDVKQLGLLCAAGHKEKLVNILVINQQLNIIDPTEILQLESNNILSEPQTIKTILKPPTMPERVNPKCKKNVKVSFGVVTADEIMQQMKQRDDDERQQEIEREIDDIAKNEREDEIKKVDEQIREIRKTLNTLRVENVTKNKEAVQKKKSKDVEDYDATLQDEAKCERQNLIKQHDDQLHELREKIKELKAAHVATNKAVSIKRKNYLQRKKEQGNLVQPSLPRREGDMDHMDDMDNMGDMNMGIQLDSEFY